MVTVADGARQSQEIRGAGDAEAIRIYAEAFGQDPEFLVFTGLWRPIRNLLTKMILW